jgi:hypothetical protein
MSLKDYRAFIKKIQFGSINRMVTALIASDDHAKAEQSAVSRTTLPDASSDNNI